jgi:hypothetical protein
VAEPLNNQKSISDTRNRAGRAPGVYPLSLPAIGHPAFALASSAIFRQNLSLDRCVNSGKKPRANEKGSELYYRHRWHVDAGGMRHGIDVAKSLV